MEEGFRGLGFRDVLGCFRVSGWRKGLERRNDDGLNTASSVLHVPTASARAGKLALGRSPRTGPSWPWCSYCTAAVVVVVVVVVVVIVLVLVLVAAVPAL